jgi:hypothetical protein
MPSTVRSALASRAPPSSLGELAKVIEEEFFSSLDTTFDLGPALGGRHEMAAFAALIKFDTIDIYTFASELAGQVDRVRRDPSFQGRIPQFLHRLEAALGRSRLNRENQLRISGW